MQMVDASKIQPDLMEFQENVAMKAIFCDCTPESFWSKKGIYKIFSHFLQSRSANCHYVWVYLLMRVCIFKYELQKEQVLHLYDK